MIQEDGERDYSVRESGKNGVVSANSSARNSCQIRWELCEKEDARRVIP
jgi:hypothetical protein